MVVTKPILSVSYLFENGTETHFAKEPFFKYGDRREPLIKKNGVHFVKAHIVHKVKGTIESCVRAEDSQNSQKSCVRGGEFPKPCVRMQNSCVQVEGLQTLKNSTVSDAIIQPVVEDPVHDDRIPVEAGAEPIPVPCESSESEKMKHEFTHIPFKPWCTSCVKGKAQSEPRKRIERIAEDSERPIVQRDYFVLNDTAAGGLKVQSMYVNSFGYGTSTVVETKVQQTRSR